MLWGNTAYCVKLSGEFLSYYSNKIETVGLRKCPFLLSHSYQESDVTIINFSQSLSHIRAENSWHRYGMKELRQRHLCGMAVCMLTRSPTGDNVP